jgi:hypothetical protein
MAQRTEVGLRGDMTINDKPVAINAVFGREFLVQIEKEFSIGSPISFAYWLRDKWEVGGPGMDTLLINDSSKTDTKYTAKQFNDLDQARKESEVITHLKAKGIPGAAVNMMATALLAEVMITDLLVQIEPAEENPENSDKILKLGLAINFGMPLNLLPGIDINRISLSIKSAPEAKFDKRFADGSQLAKLPAPARLMEAASGYIDFSGKPADNSTITLGGQPWTFVGNADSNPAEKKTKIQTDANVKATVVQLAKDLSAATEERIAACQYECAEVDGKSRLVVKYKTAGVRGNEFGLAASDNPKSNGKVSGTGKLSGGTSPLGERASGSITFKQPIGDSANIKIFTKVIPVNKAATAAELTTAITDLAKGLNSDTGIGDYIWQANGSRIDFAAKKVGKKADLVVAGTPPAIVDGDPVFYPGAEPA